MNTINIPVELAQQIIDYLQTRPYREVASLIAGIVKASEKIPEVKQ